MYKMKGRKLLELEELRWSTAFLASSHTAINAFTRRLHSASVPRSPPTKTGGISAQRAHSSPAVPPNHVWNHACLTRPSLANSCILFRLQLQKRERSCRFYVQVFATDFFCLILSHHPPPTQPPPPQNLSSAPSLS